MRSFWWSMFLVAVLTGCNSGEVRETADDVERFRQHGVENLQQLEADIARFAATAGYEKHDLELATERFFVMRKVEWWQFQREFAYHIAYDWKQVYRLTDDIATHLDYQLKNFPVVKDDILRFFSRVDNEWVSLVQDVIIYLEYQKRHIMPMSAWLQQQYDLVQWESINLQIDVQEFLEWRQREYEKLAKQAHRFYLDERNMMATMRQDLQRFTHEHTRQEAVALAVDFRQLVRDEQANVPRMGDDLHCFYLAQLDEIQLARDVERSMRQARVESERLQTALGRYARNQADEWERLREQWVAFVKSYEHEWGPMKADVKRFWEYNLDKRHVLMEDVRRFYAMGEEELYLLEAGVQRFTAYSEREWEGLKGNFRRFFGSMRQAAYGDHYLPIPGEQLASPRSATKMRQVEGYNRAQ
jgi:hypothetical protein